MDAVGRTAVDRSEDRNRRAGDEGWVTYFVGRNNEHLTEEQREFIEGERRAREERRGRLLAVVRVRVYEHDTDPQVSFPPGSLLEAATDEGEILEVVDRAAAALEEWR